MQFAVLAEARIVDQQIDPQAFFSREIINLLRRLPFRQIGGEHLRLNAMLFRQTFCHFLQPVHAPRGQHQVRATRRQFLGKRHANACARACNQGPLALPFADHPN